MLLLLAILLIIFVLFYCLNYIKNKNFSTVEIVGDIKKEKTQKMKKNALLSLLNDISSADKVILENITEEWIMTKDIIDENMKTEVKGIIIDILNNLSYISDYNFYINTIKHYFFLELLTNKFRKEK